MKAKTILKSLFISGLVLFMTTAQAQPRNNRQMNKLDCIPDLTEQQEEQIKSMRTAHLENVKSIRADIDIKRAEKRKLLLEDSPDKGAIDSKIDEISALTAELQKERANYHVSVKNILTDDQKAAWDAHPHRRGKMSKGRKHYSDKPAYRGRGM